MPPTNNKDKALASVANHARLVAERTKARDTAIVLAHQEGASLREIASAGDISHTTVANIIARWAHLNAEAPPGDRP